MKNLNEVVKIYEELKKEIAAKSVDTNKIQQKFLKLKSMLTEFSFIIGQPNKQELMIAREILELGAQWSIKTNDISSFERYILQLKTYYNDYKSILPESPRMYPLIGANLLRLLTQNRISEFHTELEQIEDCSNVFIKHPIELEQCLMEGSFGRVWHSRSNIPAEEYKFFVEMLVGTIREEIASCSESTYKELYLSDAATLLYFNTEEEVVKFAKDHNWMINNKEKCIVFKSTDSDIINVPKNKVIHQTIQYARELEKII